VPRDNLVSQGRYVSNPLLDLTKNKKEKPPKRTIQRKKEIQKMLSDIKEKSGCVDCLETYPYYILDFDHVYGVKVANISQMLNNFSLEDIMKEVAKCEIVCSNCHRERTFNRKRKAS
jgi:hypothetical protein